MGTHLNKKDARNSILKKVASRVIVVAVVIFLVGMTVFNTISNSGFLARRQIVLSSENYSVSVSEMSYFFYSAYQNILYSFQSSGLTTSTLGIDTTKSLKEQQYIFGEGTWYDNLIEQAKDSATSILVLCEAAREAGIELDDEDRKLIEDNITAMEEAADNAGYSLENYIKNSYGTIVSEADVRSALEKSILASKYNEKIIDETDVSDEVLEKEYADNKDTYDKVSYLTYTFDYEDYMPKAESDADKTETEATEATADTAADKKAEEEANKKTAVADIKKYGDELVTKTDVESFEAYVKANLIDVLGKKEADAIEAVDALEVKHASYSESSEQMKWAFSAKVGEAKVFSAENGETVTVILVTAARGRVEDVTSRDVHHILFTDETYEDDVKANEVYNQWVKDGAKLEDFKTLAGEYSEDPGSSDNGGLYEDVAEGDMITEFNDWLFDEARKEGDHGIVKTDYGWHLMYYAGGQVGWKADTEEAIQNAAIEEASEAAEKKYSVSTNEEYLDDIPA